MIGVKGREIEVIFKVVAGILHLGNVEFAPARVGAADGSTIRNPESLQWAATVLGVNPALLTKELCQKKFHTRAAGGGVRRWCQLKRTATRVGCGPIIKWQHPWSTVCVTGM